MKRIITILVIVAAALVLSISIIPTSRVHAETRPQSQILPPPLIPPPLILPHVGLSSGAIVLKHLSPGTQQMLKRQIQSDIAKDLQLSFSIQYAQAMGKEVQKRLGNDTSMAHESQVMKQMTAEGKIDCPTPFTYPRHCFFAPPGRESKLVPPEGPILLPNNSTK